MSTLLVTARAVHFASAAFLFGGLLFWVAVAEPVWRRAGRERVDGREGFERALLLIGFWCAIAAVGSAAAWLAAEAAAISGAPLADALQVDTLAAILRKTLFGRVWVLRLALVTALCVLLVRLMAKPSASVRRRAPHVIGATLLAGAYIGALAWNGHAAASQESDRTVQLTADVVHLLAAGAWLGALPGLAMLIARTQAHDISLGVISRFSTLGIASVGALIVTGIVNAWYLVGDIPGLFGTSYGHLLLAKLAVFTGMIGLAATNRWYLTPRVAQGDGCALRALRRNAILEIAAGIVVVTVVGALGVTVPAAHESTVWPFDHTLSWEPADGSPIIVAVVGGASVMACVGIAVALAGAFRHRMRFIVAGLGVTIFAAAGVAGLLVVPAFPTTYMAPPTRYDVASLANGADVYAQHCRVCHGPDGRGDGPAVLSLPVAPANLAEHASRHHQGDLFWWIAHGKAGTPMPGFSPQLTDREIWNVVQFLRLQGDGVASQALTNQVDPGLAIDAPNFAFERPGRRQESMSGLRIAFTTLVVLYSLPRSLPRLRELAAAGRAFASAGIRVVALPLNGSSAMDLGDISDQSIFAVAEPDVANIYTNFARRSSDTTERVPEHAELLIDRQGLIRARWVGFRGAASDWTSEIGAQAQLLILEQARSARPQHRVH